MDKAELMERMLPFDEGIRVYVHSAKYGVVPIVRARYEWIGGEGAVVLEIDPPPVPQAEPGKGGGT